MVGALPGIARGGTFPEVAASVDEVQAAFEDAERTRPTAVSWRTTGEVEADTLTMVPETLVAPPLSVPRADLGNVAPDYPIAVRASFAPTHCVEPAANWIHGSDFITSGHSWMGLRGTEAGLLGYDPSNAANGSKLQFAELAVAGSNRFPPRVPNPGGHVEARTLGASRHRITWIDPTESCFIGGVRQVDGDLSYHVTALEALGGDVDLQAGDELPRIRVPLPFPSDQGIQVGTILPGRGLPGIPLDFDLTIVADEDGKNPKLQIDTTVVNGGTWHRTRRTELGTDWQLRLLTYAYREAVDFGSQQPPAAPSAAAERGVLDLFPGETAVVITRDGGEERVDRVTADSFEQVRVTGEGAELVTMAAEHPAGTPFPQLNSCPMDQPADGVAVNDPGPAPDPGSGRAVRTAGVGDPSLPYAIPPDWIGYTVDRDEKGAPSLEDITIAGTRFGDAGLAYARTDGGYVPLDDSRLVEGPISYEYVLPDDHADGEGGIAYNTLMTGMVFRVGGVDLRVYWVLHAKVMGDSRGIGGCAVLYPMVAEGMSQEAEEIDLIWLTRANILNREKTYVRNYDFAGSQGYTTVAQEKSWDRGTPFVNLLDDYRFFGIRDKDDAEQRLLFQHWDEAAGITAVTRFHGTGATDPEAEVNGESIDGADIGIYVQQSGLGGEKVWEHQPFLIMPCGPCGSF
jgi:hypothetical protein